MSSTNAHNDKLVWYQQLALEVLWAVCSFIGYMPRWFQYKVVGRLVYLLLRVVRYRSGVIRTNLEQSFPEKDEHEIERIVKATYRNLAEVIVDTIALAGATKRGDLHHVTWVNRDEHIERTKGRDWIAMASHYSCWEYFLLWSIEAPESQLMGVYHPLKSPVFEHFYRRLRNFAPNISQVTMQDTVRHYIRNRSTERNIVLGLISDQTPNLRADTEWIEFLNRKTAFIEGGEKLGRRFHIPLYFTYIERLGPGHISIRFDEIYDGYEEVEDMEITRRYAEHLERMIKAKPELWMWSHKRWKHSPEKQARRFGKMTKSGEE